MDELNNTATIDVIHFTLSTKRLKIATLPKSIRIRKSIVIFGT